MAEQEIQQIQDGNDLESENEEEVIDQMAEIESTRNDF